MIYCSDNYTLNQLKKWQAKANEALANEVGVRDGFIAWCMQSKGADMAGMVKRTHAIHEVDEATKWAHNFIGYLNRWQYQPEDSGRIIKLWASQRDEKDGYVSEFSVVVCQREVDGNQMFDDEVDRIIMLDAGKLERGDGIFSYNGGFINHGTVDEPKWSMHT